MTYESGSPGWAIAPLNWIRLLQEIPGYRITAIYDWIEPLHASFAGTHPLRRRCESVLRL